MAERRMFAKTIVLSDAFLDMPLTARCLYFTLGMLADDDGFINGPKSIIRQCGASEDDLKMLFAKKFILPFDTGVIVIKHWRVNNYLRNDRYKETIYVDEKKALEVDDNNIYHVGIPSVGIPSIGKVRLGKDSIGYIEEQEAPKPKTKKKIYGEYDNVKLTDEEHAKLVAEYPTDYQERIDRLSGYIASKGDKYKSHYATIRNWARKDAKAPQEERKTSFMDIEF